MLCTALGVQRGVVCGFDPQENALTGMAKAFVLGQNIHNGMVGSGRLAVGGGAVLCRFGVGCRFVNGIHDQNQNGQGNGQQDEGVVSGQGGKAKENGAHGGAEQGKAGKGFGYLFHDGASFHFMVLICF